MRLRSITAFGRCLHAVKNLAIRMTWGDNPEWLSDDILSEVFQQVISMRRLQLRFQDYPSRARRTWSLVILTIVDELRIVYDFDAFGSDNPEDSNIALTRVFAQCIPYPSDIATLR